MTIEIVMPRLSDSMEEGTIAQWLVAAGDVVKPGDPLVEVETDKATVTYESEHEGTILLLAATEGESVAVGALIAAVGEPGETVAVATTDGGRSPGVPTATSRPDQREIAVPSTVAQPRSAAQAAIRWRPRYGLAPLARRVAKRAGRRPRGGHRYRTAWTRDPSRRRSSTRVTPTATGGKGSRAAPVAHDISGSRRGIGRQGEHGRTRALAAPADDRTADGSVTFDRARLRAAARVRHARGRRPA